MKKSLVAALVLSLGVTTSALAANPFSDVPAGHWAYGSIAKLSAAGVVDGYPDGTFQGDKLMTRYEMAQIVARAMAKGANVDRLASEFADELDALGVRVAKLEKKSDNVRITGQVRISYYDTVYKNDATGVSTNDNAFRVRSRLFFTGKVNDNWNYIAMLENNHNYLNDMGNSVTPTTISDENGEGIAFQRAYLQGRLGGAKMTMGRFSRYLVDGNIFDNRQDVIQAEYGKKVRVSAYYGRPTNIAGKAQDYDKTWGGSISGDIGKLTLVAGYDKFTNSVSGKWSDDGIWDAGAVYDFGNASLSAYYLKSSLDEKDLGSDAATGGFIIGAKYKGALASKPNSWGLFAKYYNQGAGTFLNHTMASDASYFALAKEGIKGYMGGVNYTVAKNIVADIEYYDLKGRETDNSLKSIWSHMMVTF